MNNPRILTAIKPLGNGAKFICSNINNY